MTLPYEEAGPTRPAPSKAVTTTTARKSNWPTQYRRVLDLLLLKDEVCSVEFYRQPIPRFAVYIHMLRKAGYWITKRPCDLADHNHLGTCWLYKLEAIPEPVR